MESMRVSLTEFCQHHQIDPSFVYSLQDHNIIEVEMVDEDACIVSDRQLFILEKFVRLHYDLHINLEGLDAIHHLLERMEHLQNEVKQLRTRLALYEAGDV
jgi:hypothetical protein